MKHLHLTSARRAQYKKSRIDRDIQNACVRACQCVRPRVFGCRTHPHTSNSPANNPRFLILAVESNFKPKGRKPVKGPLARLQQARHMQTGEVSPLNCLLAYSVHSGTQCETVMTRDSHGQTGGEGDSASTN